MAIKLIPTTEIHVKYYHVNRYWLTINKKAAELIQTPHSSGPLTYRTLAEVLEHVAPKLMPFAEYIWDIVAGGKPTPIWEIRLNGEQILRAAEEAGANVDLPAWDLVKDGLLNAPKFLIEQYYGEEVLGRFTAPDLFMWVGYDDRSLVQWIAWARRNGATFNDVASIALLSVARPGGEWVGSARVPKKPQDGHLIVGDLDNDIDFVHYDKAGAGQVKDGFLGAQTTGRHRLIAYRNDYPYDPSASYPWEM